MMKNLLTIALVIFTSACLFGQELTADDRVTITQSAKPFIGVYAFGYQGLPTPGYPQFQLNNYGGVPGPGGAAATADNSILGLFAFSGHNGSAKRTVGIIRVKAMNNFATNLSSRMDFLIGPNREQRMTILGDSGNVGIGTALPENQLDIYKEDDAVVGITADDNNTAVAELRLRTNDTPNDELFIRKYGSSAGGSFNNGLPLADMSVVTSGTAAGPLYTGTLGNNPVYLAANNEVAMYLDTDQDVGVNTQNPGAQLHVLETEGTNTSVIYGQSTYTGNSDRYAVQGNSVNNPGYGYGGYFQGGYKGVYARANATTYTGTSTGVHGYASGTAGTRRGVYAQASNPGGLAAYGSYSVATNATTNYGVYGTASGGAINWAGYFNGNTYVDDTLTVDNRVYINSDETKSARLVVMESANTDAIYVKNFGSSTTNIGGYGIEIDAGYRGIDIDMNDNDIDGSHYGYFISNLTGGGELTGSQYGMYTYTSGARAAGGGNYSLYAQQGGTTGAGTNWAGYFAGSVRVTGTLDNTSDARLKRDVEDMDDALDIIKQLKPKTYQFKADEYPHMALDTRPQLGFIAQDMEKVLPQLVRTAVHPEFVNDEGEESDIPNSPAVDVKSINYIGIIPVLTQGIKELTTEVEEKDEAIEELTNKVALLEDQLSKIENVDELLSQISAVEDKLANLDKMTIRMEQLEKDLQSCCLNSNAEPKVGSTITTIELNGDKDQAQLEQNAPNPFNAETSINYYIPASATKAQLTITDIKGAILKTVNLEAAGFGAVNIRAGELAPGTYAYTLTVDGERVETKQMVLVK